MKLSAKHLAPALLFLFNNEIISIFALIVFAVMFLMFLIRAAEERA